MNKNNSIMKLLWVHVITYLVLIHQTAATNNSYTELYPWCRDLLLLKQELFPDGVKLCSASWKQSLDCCQWDRVGCDASRGLVVELDLSSCDLSSIPSNSTLFTLTYLQKLNLAYNYFHGSPTQLQLGRLNSLTHLDLTYSLFSGEIPTEWYHLSNLESLDLFRNDDLSGDINMLLGNMTKLREVYLSGIHFNTSQLPANISSFLSHLDLQGCGLVGTLPPTIFEKPDLRVLYLDYNYDLRGSLPSLNSSNVRSIEKLDLSMTSISGRLPESIGFMTNLRYLMLISCMFWGPIPDSIGNMTGLQQIYLLENNFTGQLPSTISNLWQLEQMDISYNNLDGIIPSLANMSLLYSFSVFCNVLTGSIPSVPSTVKYLDFSHNSIHGTIPSCLLTLPALTSLDLSFNKLTGNIGNFHCQNLNTLDLSYNQLDIVFESFYNLSQLLFLHVSHNSRSKQVIAQIVNPITLDSLIELDFSSCGIVEIPDMVKNLSRLEKLELSDNKIQGPTPDWFNSISLPNLEFLNLSTNHLTSAENLPSQLYYLNLDSNSLQETFPLSVCNMSELSILILSNNKLGGQIPECIRTFTSSLVVLNLRRNQLRGKIPETIGSAVVLKALQVNGNRLEGSLPRSLANCTFLVVLDLGNNVINDTFPLWLEAALPKLKILILRSNRFHGSIGPIFSNDSFSKLQIIDLSHNSFSGLLPEKLFSRLQAMKSLDQMDRTNPYLEQIGLWVSYLYSVNISVKGTDLEFIKVVNIFTSIDLSSNNFQGTIPESIAYLYSLRLLNLSHNNITGRIPPALGNLKELEQLDLSHNHLTGGIPQTLRSLTFLADLDVSYNHLVGPIPQGNQFSTFTNDSFAGNSLCGNPLTKSCGNDKAPPSPAEQEDERDKHGIMMGFTWEAVVIGYGCGLVFGFIIGTVMIALRKPIFLARFVYAEATTCLKRRRRNRGGR